MLDFVIAVIMTVSQAASAAPGPLPEFGTSGFTGTTVREAAPVPTDNEIIEQREPVQASRQSERSAPPAQTSPQPAAQPAAPEPAPVVTGGVLEVAAAYVGSPYVLMGTPPAAFDCSAYTWWVFKQAGISIPRSVNGQAAAVTPVSNPQPGDLIFYNDYHHVGIYAGNGMTYEALNPSSGVRFGPMVSDNVWFGRP